MFNDFLYHLRQYGLDVSTKEWLTLQEALKMQLHGCSINGLFTLSRAILCKSETEYDKFEVAFLDYFQDVIRYVEASGKDDISAQILDWVNNPARNGARIIRKTAEDITDEMRNWTREDIEKKFRHRLKSQRSEHNGGYHYVGTHGISPFGNSGSNPNAIRVGGKPMSRSALRVAGQRTFQDFREDNVLSIRQFQMAFRRLCRYSEQNGVKEELDVEKTIHDTCQKGGLLQIRYKKPRKNHIKVLLLMDSGGSMGPYSQLCSQLFQAASRSNRFKDLKTYFLHNCVEEYLYTNPTLEEQYAVSTQKVLRECGSEYKVILVGDAAMDMSDLTFHPLETTQNNQGFSGQDWLRAILKQYPYAVWLTPFQMPKDGLFGDWGQTYDIISAMFPLYPLTVQGLEQALKRLLVKN